MEKFVAIIHFNGVLAEFTAQVVSMAISKALALRNEKDYKPECEFVATEKNAATVAEQTKQFGFTVEKGLENYSYILKW